MRNGVDGTSSRAWSSATRSQPRRVHALPPAVTALLALLALFNVLGAIALIPDRGGDFAMIYRSTTAWMQGLPPYESPGTPTTNLNHPLIWLLVLPFTSVPESVAFILWTAISLGLFAAAAAMVSRVARTRPLDIAVLVLASTAASFELALGQIAFALMVPLLGAWWFDRDGREVPAGACIGLLCVLKPFFGLLALMFAWRRQWRALGACVVAALLTLVVGWLLAGTDGYRAWIANLRGVTWTWHIFNGSVWGAASRLFTEQQVPIAAAWTPLVISPLLAGITAALGIAVIVFVLWRGLRRADVDERYALISLACLLLSPLGWVYYLPACFAPIVVTLARRPSVGLWGVGALAMCPYPVLVNRQYSLLATLTAGQISFIVTGGLFLLVATAAGQEPEAGRVYTSQPGSAS